MLLDDVQGYVCAGLAGRRKHTRVMLQIICGGFCCFVVLVVVRWVHCYSLCLLHQSFLPSQEQDSCPAARGSPHGTAAAAPPAPQTPLLPACCCRSEKSVSVVTHNTRVLHQALLKQAKNDIHHPPHCCRRLVVHQLLKPKMQQGPLTTAAARETNCCNQAWAPACVSTQQQQTQKQTVIIMKGALLCVCMLVAIPHEPVRPQSLLTSQHHLHTLPSLAFSVAMHPPPPGGPITHTH